VIELLLSVHPWLGYVATVVVLLVALLAFRRAKDAREFTHRPYAAAMVLLDVQVLLGILLYAAAGYWNAASPLIAYVHPIVGLAALGVGHAGVGAARKERMVVEAHRKVGRALIVTLVLVFVAIGVASAA
jgi:hypothetical protein